MDFITQNYLWIIIFIIVILMAIVGYIADKTEFIKKSEKNIKPKKEEKEQPIVIENEGIDELLKKTTKKSSKSKNKEEKADQVIESEVTPLNDDIMSPLVSEPINEDNTTIDESLFAPLESSEINNSNGEINDELKPIEVTPLENIETNDEIPVVNEEEDIWKF